MHTKNFLLLLGSQKCGTSWLFDFLSSVPEVKFGYSKEMHVFDRLQFAKFLKIDIKKLKDSNNILNSQELLHRLLMISNPTFYFDYFENILNKFKLTGDCSPNYCLLDEERLSYIKNNLSLRKINIKVIFLMRDPVERIHSANCMTNRIMGTNFKLLDSYNKKFVEGLTRYEIIIPKIKKVFSKNDIYINFYENLFKQSTIDQILEFLCLPKLKPDFNKFVNSSKKSPIKLSDRLVVEDYYKDTYDYINKNFNTLKKEFHKLN